MFSENVNSTTNRIQILFLNPWKLIHIKCTEVTNEQPTADTIVVESYTALGVQARLNGVVQMFANFADYYGDINSYTTFVSCGEELQWWNESIKLIVIITLPLLCGQVL